MVLKGARVWWRYKVKVVEDHLLDDHDGGGSGDWVGGAQKGGGAEKGWCETDP